MEVRANQYLEAVKKMENQVWVKKQMIGIKLLKDNL